MIDIPTAVTNAEAVELSSLASGKTVLEAGALLGHSTVTLALTAKHVVSVDPHEGYPEHDPRPTLQPFLDNLTRCGVRDKVTVCIGTHEDVFPYLDEDTFDLVFLDLTGHYEDTWDAMQRAIPLLTVTGVLAVHDCGHSEWPGVQQAVREFAEDVGGEPRLVDRLAVFRPYL